MKKTIIVLIAVLLSLFTSCSERTNNKLSSENISSETNISQNEENPDTEAIAEILKSEIYLYEQGCYGMEYTEGEYYKQSYNLPRFARVFCQLNNEEDNGQKLIKLATKVYFDMEINEQNLVSGVAFDLRQIDIVPQKIYVKNDTAEIKAEIYLNGYKIYDTIYSFYREDMPESFKNTIFEQLAFNNSIWKIEKVVIPDTKPITEIIEINNTEDFMQFANGVNNREREYVSGKFILTNDIDLTNCEYFGAIGYYSDWNIYEENSAKFISPMGFNGEFDGQGHTIFGFNIEKASRNLGFFKLLNEDAVIKNLNLKGNVINAIRTNDFNICTGGFAGIVSPNAVIENCSFTGNVDGKCYTGGFVGMIKNTGSDIHVDSNGFEIGGNGYISDCTFNGQVNCAFYGGGFAGSSIGLIRNCRCEGDVIIDKKYGGIPYTIGGFCGESYYTIDSCHCSSKVTHYVKGTNQMGNFIGGLGQYNITNCTIDKNIVHSDWYMVGIKYYRNTQAEIKIN